MTISCCAVRSFQLKANLYFGSAYILGVLVFAGNDYLSDADNGYDLGLFILKSKRFSQFTT